jgi:pilus assembly protein CpaF
MIALRAGLHPITVRYFQATGVRPRFLSHLTNLGITIPGSYFDPSKQL